MFVSTQLSGRLNWPSNLSFLVDSLYPTHSNLGDLQRLCHIFVTLHLNLPPWASLMQQKLLRGRAHPKSTFISPADLLP